jgi:thiol-disulfide isomerase/thioredoxin
MNDNFIKTILLFLVLAAIGAVIFYLESQKPAQLNPGDTEELARSAGSTSIKEKATRYEPAVEIVGPTGFINSESFALKDFIGEKVILLDFWTYSCINCQRTLPYLNSWYEKYKDKGFIIVGVHTPEFEFEKEYDNVLAAVAKYGVEYPVVLDNNYTTWRAYNNRYWPRKYLIDVDGFIVYDHIGEGAYQETEEKIIALLNERNLALGDGKIDLDMSVPEDAEEVDFDKVKTPETYLGYSRLNSLVNLPSVDCFDKECEFELPGDIRLNGHALGGYWQIGNEEISLKRGNGSILIRFSANKVNLVAKSQNGGAKAQIFIDGKLIEEMNAGRDVFSGMVSFNEADLYNLVDLRGEYGEHVLEIKILEGEFSAFAFTFG